MAGFQSNTKPGNQCPAKPPKEGKPRPKPAKIETIMFCPYTPGSALKKELTKVEEFMNKIATVGRVRFIERAGPKLKNLLCNKTPWVQDWCGRDQCPPCQTKPGSCRAINLVYQISCQDCQAS